MKLCKDCKHVEIVDNRVDYKFYKCNSPKRKHTINPVIGEKEYRFHFCKTQRVIAGFFFTRFMGACGESGRFFEPK